MKTILTLRIVPNAKKTEVIGSYGDALKIKLHAPPVEGKANAALLEYLSEALKLPRNAITLLAGEKSRNKRVQIEGLSEPEILTQLRAK